MKLPPHWLPINLVGLDLGLWGQAIQRYAEAYARTCVKAALEEAAKKLESHMDYEAAAVIRRLSGEIE